MFSFLFLFFGGFFCFVFFCYSYFLMLLGLEVSLLASFVAASVFYFFSGGLFVLLVIITVVVFMGGFGLCILINLSLECGEGKYFF